MATDFSALKKNGSNIQKLSEQLEKMSGNSTSFVDERIWAPTPDKAGNYSGIIRFLPAPRGEDAPFVRRWNHGFKNSQGKWFIQNCPTSIGKPCPICEANSTLYNSGDPRDKELVSGSNGRKRKLSYYANILVIKDPEHKENEGKVFLFRYGKQIHEKIEAALKPQYDDETPLDVFDFWGGANFQIRCKKNEGGYPSYLDSKFSSPSALLNGDDAKLESIWNSQHSLEEFISPSEFLDYSELKEKLESFLGSQPIEESMQNIQRMGNVSQERAQDSIPEMPPFNVNDSEDEDDDNVLKRLQQLMDDDE